MTRTYHHTFQTGHRLLLVITRDSAKENFRFTWIPELRNVTELDEVEEEFEEWADFQSDSLMEEGQVFEALRFEATCGMEWLLRYQQLEQNFPCND